MRMEVVARVYFNPQSLKDAKDAVEQANKFREDGCSLVELIPTSDLIDMEVYLELEDEGLGLYGNRQKGYKFKFF